MNPNPYEPPRTDPNSEPPLLAALVGEDGGMSIDFEVWREDLISFALYHHRNSAASRRQRTSAIIALCVIFGAILAIIAWFALSKPELWWGVIVILVVVGILLIQHPKTHERQLRKVVQRMYGEGRNLLLYGPRRVGLTPQFINHSSPYHQSVTRWIVVEKVATTSDALYIYISSVSSVVIPRRAFSSDDHFQTFVRTAEEFHRRAMAAENPLAVVKS